MRLYREEHGYGHPLLLITGLGYAIWSWQRQIPEWSRRFRTVAIENRGSGRSPKPSGPYSIEQLADDAAEASTGGARTSPASRWAATSPRFSRSGIPSSSTGSCSSAPARAAPSACRHGDADRVVPDENGLELARRIPGARFQAFPGGGHLLFLESPERLNPLVADFLS